MCIIHKLKHYHVSLAGVTLAILFLSGCDITNQPILQTEAVGVAQTVMVEGKNVAATQLQYVKETAEAELATQIAGAASGIIRPKVLLAREQLKLMSAMKSPWRQVDAPIQNASDQRSAGTYADVIDQFDVGSADFAGRYEAGGSDLADTRCNIFAGDVMRAMGVPLPTKGNLGRGQGDPNATYTDPMTATASQLNDYLNLRIKWVTSADDPGIESDWEAIDPTKTDDLTRLIDHVNAGKPAIISDSGHIAVIRPGQPMLQSWQDLIIAQAGASNFLSGTLKGHFFGTPQFFIHD